MTVVAAIRTADRTYMASDQLTGAGVKYYEPTKIERVKGDLYVGMAGDADNITEGILKLRALEKRRKKITVEHVRGALRQPSPPPGSEKSGTDALVCCGRDIWVVDSDGSIIPLDEREEVAAVGAGAGYVYGYLASKREPDGVDFVYAIRGAGYRIPDCGGVSPVVVIEHG